MPDPEPHLVRAAISRPQYRIYSQQWLGKKRWKAERILPDATLCAIGNFNTRKEATATMRLLAGWRGDVTVCK
jgi:hypothetical protein